MPEKLHVLVVGLGHMGVTHAKAYDRIDGYELAGLCCGRYPWQARSRRSYA
jgi:hypothetical protein